MTENYTPPPGALAEFIRMQNTYTIREAAWRLHVAYCAKHGYPHGSNSWFNG